MKSYHILTLKQQRRRKRVLLTLGCLLALLVLGWVGGKCLILYGFMGICWWVNRQRAQSVSDFFETLLENLNETDSLNSDLITDLTPYGCTLSLGTESRLQQAMIQTLRWECESAQLPHVILSQMSLPIDIDETQTPIELLLITPKGLLILGGWDGIGEVRGNIKSKTWKWTSPTGRSKEQENPLRTLQSQLNQVGDYLETLEIEPISLATCLVADPETVFQSSTLNIPSILKFPYWIRRWNRKHPKAEEVEAFQRLCELLIPLHQGICSPRRRTSSSR